MIIIFKWLNNKKCPYLSTDRNLTTCGIFGVVVAFVTERTFLHSAGYMTHTNANTFMYE